jgi:gamma-glutamylaminecyclotransferase
MKIGDKVMVYGTLRRGQSNFRVMEGGVTFVGNCMMVGAKMFSLGGAFPGVKVDDTLSHAVHGELFIVNDEETIRRMDRLEGHPNFYERQLHKVDTPDETHDAWVYIYQHDTHGELIASGDWLNREAV